MQYTFEGLHYATKVNKATLLSRLVLSFPRLALKPTMMETTETAGQSNDIIKSLEVSHLLTMMNAVAGCTKYLSSISEVQLDSITQTLQTLAKKIFILM